MERPGWGSPAKGRPARDERLALAPSSNWLERLGGITEQDHDHHAEGIRLIGIDRPEKGQAYGNRAKQAVSALVFSKEVTLQTYGRDKYGRTLADVFLPDRTNGNHELVKEGWCWWYRK